MSDLIQSIALSGIPTKGGKDFVTPTGDQFITAGPTREEVRAKAPDRGVLGAINDNVIEIANAAAGGVSSIANMVSPGNRVSKFIEEEIIKPGEEAQSDAVKAEKRLLRQDLQNAQGATDEVGAYLSYLANNPGLAISQVAGSFAIPGVAARGATRLAGAAGLGQKAASRFGLGAVSATSGAMAGGDAAGSAYDLVKRTPKQILEQNAEYRELAASMGEEQALEEIATRAARNASALPAVIGATLGPLGAERILAGAGRARTASRVKNAGITGGIEAGTEGFEEGATQYSGQKAASEYNPTIDPMKGVAGAATMGAVMGAGPGIVTGALETPAAPNPLQPVIDQAEKPGSVLSRAVVATGAADQAAAQQAVQTSAADPISGRVAAAEQVIRDAGVLEKLRGMGPQMGAENLTNDFLYALQVARNPNSRPDQRQAAIEQVEQAIQWTQTGFTSPAPQAPQQPGTAVAVRPNNAVGPVGQPQFFDPNVVDVDATDVSNRLPGPAAIEQPMLPGAEGLPQIGMDDADTGNLLVDSQGNVTPETRVDQINSNQARTELAEVNRGGPGFEQQVAPGQQAPDAETRVASREQQKVAPATVTNPANQTTPAGSGTAVGRRRSQTIQQLVDQGFETVERREGEGGGFFLKNSKTGAEIKLDGMADAAMARNLIQKSIRAQADQSPNSPRNDLPESTEAQNRAGNYKKPPVSLNGFTIRIENPAGSVRRGVDKDGVAWESEMKSDYGYIENTKAKDGDGVDVVIGNRADSSKIFVIDQVNPDGSFDEPKVVMGVTDEDHARRTYLSNYEEGWTGLGAITEMTRDQFNDWLKSGGPMKATALGRKQPAAPQAAPQATQQPAPQAAQQGAKQGTFATLEEAKQYLSQQRRANGSVSGLPLQLSDGSYAIAAKGTPQYAEAERQRDQRERSGEQVGQGDFFTIKDGGKQRKLKRVKKSELPKKAASVRRLGEPRAITQEEAGLIEQIAAVLGKRVVFFESQDGRIGDGFFDPTQPDVLFVATETTVNPLAVFGHEFFHDLRETNPEAWNAIAAVVRARVADPKGFRADYYGEQAAEQRGDAPLSNERGGELEELVSDLGGNLMMDATFWRDVFGKIRKDNGSEANGIIARLAAALERFVARVMNAIGQGGFRANSFVTDLDSVRRAYRDALADHIRSAGVRPSDIAAEIDRDDSGLRKSMAGRGANTADKYQLARAEEMLDAGKDPEAVRKETGWHKGVDGKWRFEISDDQAKPTEILENPRARSTFLTAGYDIDKKRIDAEKRKALRAKDKAYDEYIRIREEVGSKRFGDKAEAERVEKAADKLDEAMAVYRELMGKHPDMQIRLGDVLDHVQLFAAYPELRNVRVNFESSIRPGEGSFIRALNTIELSEKADAQTNLSVILHEVQHAIQYAEGFARGGSPERMVRYSIEKSREILEKEFGDLPSYKQAKSENNLDRWVLNTIQATGKGLSPFEAYRRLAGEVEARSTQRRAKMTDEERMLAGPDVSADVPDSDVIVVFNDEEMRSAQAPANAGGILKSTARPEGLTVEGYHFSKAPRQVLNSAMYGTGLKGSAREEILQHGDDRLKHRISFYVNKGTGINPESGVGGVAHKATLTNVYDADADLLRLRSGNAREFESKVLDAGYDGYLSRMEGSQSGNVIMLGKRTIRPEVLGLAAKIDDAKVVPPPVQREQDLADRIMANKALPSGMLSPQRWSEVLMAQDPDLAAQLLDIGALEGTKGMYKDELAAKVRELSGEIRKSADRARQEYAEIEAKYKGTDAWLKAPNGNATNLSKRQWVQVRTPSFKKWFGDWEKHATAENPVGSLWSDDTVSKAVDKNGEPLVVYHGTDKGGFTSFEEPGGTGRGDLGIWTTPNYGMARSYVRKGRARDVELTALPSTREELEELGFTFFEQDDGTLEVDTPSGYTESYDNEQDAIKGLIENYAEDIDANAAGTQPGVYALFIDIKNPNEDNFEGAMWNGDREDQYQVRDENDEPIYDDEGRSVFSYSTAEALVAQNPGAELQPADPHYNTTDDVVREARRYNNDGAIIREVVDDGGGVGYDLEPSDIFVTFDQRQVKSADYNNGEFSDSTDDIRMSADRLIREDDFEMSTRIPTAKGKAVEDHVANLLISDFHSGKSQEKWINSVANLVTQYPNYREVDSAKTPEKKIERLIRQMTDNLVWLHNQVPESTRQRSKLWYDGASAIAGRMSKRYDISKPQAAGILAALSPQKDWFMNVSLADRVASIMAERQQFRWSPEMEQTAARIYKGEQYQVALGQVRGKTLAQLDGDDYLASVWLRVYDQTYNSRAFDIVSPEGDSLAKAQTKKGVDANVAWGGNSTIAKAVSIFRDGGAGNISDQLGNKHKVRNFYNNILVPNSRNGHVTIDTHAVAAALLRPLSGNSVEVKHNFGGTSNAITGLQGTYALYEEAYRRAAKDLGLLPRELQSIAWEAIRGMYVPGFKSQAKNVESIDKIWTQFKKGRLSYDGAREFALETAGGIEAPSWLGRNPGIYVEEQLAAESEDVSGDGVPGGDSDEVVIRADGDDSGAAAQDIRASRDRSRGQEAGGTADRALEASERAAAQEALSPLPGAPAVKGATGPDPHLVAVAERYARDNGIELRRQAEFVKADPERGKRIAEAYAAMAHDPQNPRVKEAYQNLIRQTRAQYDALAAAGYKFWFMDMNLADNQEYASSPWNAMRDIRANQSMGVFPTADGFGTSEEFSPDNNPLLEDTGLRWPVGGAGSTRTAPVLANDLFRAVHDAFGHGLEGAGFRADGEENAWQAHVRLFTGSAVAAITTETRGQNSWLNFGPHGEKNRTAKVEDTVFADQKTGLLPEWVWTEGRVGDMPASEPSYNQRVQALKDLISCLQK